MEMKLRQTNGKDLYQILCVLTGVIVLLPVACNYIMTGGIISEWITRTEELAAGPVHLFPSAETLMSMWSRENGMDSNLWFFPTGIIFRVSGSMVLTYRIYMLALQVCTLLCAKLFFERLFAECETKLPAFFGILLYMTSPYRIYICYDLADMSAAVVWMILPLYAWSLLGIFRGNRNWLNMAVASLSLAGIGYADTICFFVFAGITVIAVIWFKKVLPLLSIAAGTVFFLPVLYRLIQYLFLGAYEELGLPVRAIMQNGYRFGQFFSTYAFRESHPGMGLGLFICLLAGIWLRFVDGRERGQKHDCFFLVLSILLLLLSMRYFPWDLVQRFGTWALKLVSLINTPAIFSGIAWSCLCIPAAASTDRMTRQENKYLAFAFPVIVLLFCLGVCIYQCNMLTYSRLSMDIL